MRGGETMNTGGIVVSQAPSTAKTMVVQADRETNYALFDTFFTDVRHIDEPLILVEEVPTEQQENIEKLLAILTSDSLSDLEKDTPVLSKELLDLLISFKDEGLLPNLELELDECLVNPEQVLTINLLDLYTLIKQIGSADVEEWSESKAAGMAEAVKLAKINLLSADTQVMKPQDIPLTKELKQLLENLSAKLDKLSGANLEDNKSHSAVKEKNSKISLDALRSTFTRIVGDEGNSFEKSKPVTMKTNESSLGTLPFQMSKLEQYRLTTEKNGQPIDQEQFIKQFEKIMSKASFTGTNGMQKLLIKLNPEHLGALRIEIIQKDTGLTARIMATTSKGKEMLETQLLALKQSFAGQGILVDKIDITQTTSFQERYTPRDTESQQQRQQSKEQEEDSEETQNEFTHRFAEALVNYEV